MTVTPHSTGVAKAYESDRSDASLVFPEDLFLTGMDLNDMQRIERNRARRNAELVAKSGDRVSGADIIVTRDPDPATTVSLVLAAGTIYVDGDVLPVATRSIASVAGTGEVRVGVRLVKTLVGSGADASLVGPLPGSEAEGEPAATRVVETISWSLETENLPGVFYPVYTLRDGTPLDQTPPPALTNVTGQIAVYDYDANGHYIVRGCDVSAFGKVGSDQVFSIREGTANVLGFKRVRESAMRFVVAEEPDLEAIVAEPHTYTAATGAPNVITTNRSPIASVQQVIVTKRITETIVRGGISGGQDALTKSSVVQIEEVKQGATTYTPTTDYTLTGNSVSWAPGGAEPATSSSYNVTYLYNEAQAIDSSTQRTITVSGGVNGRPILVSYTWKIPRVDLICLDVTGRPVYVKGVSARVNAVAPAAPESLLKLAEVQNTWFNDTKPGIINNGSLTLTVDEQQRLKRLLLKVTEQYDRSESGRDIFERNPVSKNGIFQDNFIDDFYRDAGEAQTAAAFGGMLCLAVDVVLNNLVNTNFLTLPFTEEIAIRQDLKTSGMKINPYANFVSMPAGLTLSPAIDLWTETVTTFTSPITREFQAAPGMPEEITELTQEVSTQQRAAEFIRQISVGFTIEGFGVAETLAELTFDGVNVTPSGPLTANSSGVITGSFTVPANIPVGRRAVAATGGAGSFARAIYVGEGTITSITARRVTLVARQAPIPEPPVVPPIVVVTEPVINDPPVITWGGEGGGGGEGSDPLAQTFALTETRMIVGLNFWLDAIGDRANGIRVQLCTVQNGLPTNEVLAEDFIPMATPNVGDMLQARFSTPVLCQVGRQYAFVILTDDADHAVKVAKLGDVYDLGGGRQARVSQQPYTTGVLLASSNRITWTPVQDADLAFQVVVASFTSTTRTVNLWTGAFTNISDLIVRSALEIPDATTSVRWELVRADGSVVRFADRQQVPFSAFVTETVTLRAVLQGNAKLSPTIFPGVRMLAGRIRTSGTYVTRAFPMGTGVTVRALFAALLPAGSGVTIEADAADDNWQSMGNVSTGLLANGWTEPLHQRTPHTAAPQGRIRVTLTGGPGARPFLARFKAYSY